MGVVATPVQLKLLRSAVEKHGLVPLANLASVARSTAGTAVGGGAVHRSTLRLLVEAAEKCMRKPS